MVRYYRCSRCGGSWQFTRGRDGIIDRSERVGGRGGRQFSLLVGPKVAQIRVTDTTTTPNASLVAAASPKPLLAMVSGWTSLVTLIAEWRVR
jgi:hypothetical protein